MNIQSIENKEISEDVINRSVNRILNVVLKAQEAIQNSDLSTQFGVTMGKVKGVLDEHHQISREIAENSIFLLKNEDSLLPFSPDSSKDKTKIIFVGEFAEKPHAVGIGSGGVDPYKVDSYFSMSVKIIENLNKNFSVSYVKGFDAEHGMKDDSFHTAIQQAKEFDIVVVFAGTPLYQEGETKDLKNIKLREDENSLINEICQVNQKVVIVLQNASPIEMPWIDNVRSILETYFCGESGGVATANNLFGIVNPSGHLAESFPISLEDNPSYNNFNKLNIKLKEDVFVSYHY